jgi:peptidoglycan hydrolase CwlO-like protein
LSLSCHKTFIFKTLLDKEGFNFLTMEISPVNCYDECMGKWKKVYTILFIGAYLSVAFYPTPIFAQTAADSLATQAQLQQQLQLIQDQITGLTQQLAQTQAQKNTLANKIKSLQKQQAVLNLQIASTNLQINDLGSQITVTQGSIAQNTSHVKDLQNQISVIVRTINQNDSYPFIFTAVSQKKLSDVFSVYEDYARISSGLGSVISQLKSANDQLSTQKQNLSDQQLSAQNLLSIKTLQQTGLTGSVKDQSTLLAQTKGREADYQATISDTKAQAAAIRSRLYQLLGVSSQITFGQALQIAQWAKGSTGIDPAFLLAVLTQESNLGQNVGTCNRPGDPPSKSYKVVMNPTRDIPPFLQITQSLGMDPDITPVSCPMRNKDGSQLGWGGAMGPAQFIPSTWMGYKDKVAVLTGNNPANPWDIRDAFAAAAIKLTAGGADGTYQGNWNAAMRYFSGSTNVKYRFYGDNVMATATKYQSDINDLAK